MGTDIPSEVKRIIKEQLDVDESQINRRRASSTTWGPIRSGSWSWCSRSKRRSTSTSPTRTRRRFALSRMPSSTSSSTRRPPRRPFARGRLGVHPEGCPGPRVPSHHVEGRDRGSPPGLELPRARRQPPRLSCTIPLIAVFVHPKSGCGPMSRHAPRGQRFRFGNCVHGRGAVVSRRGASIPRAEAARGHSRQGPQRPSPRARRLSSAGTASCASGWGAPAWPVEFGGTGWSRDAAAHLRTEELSSPARRRTAVRPVDGRARPHAVRHRGAEEALPAAHPRRRRRWCQGYSEPDAGCDLASLKTRAERDGDALRRQRPEDVDHASPVRRLDLLPRAHRPGGEEAGGHLLPAHRHEDAGRHGAARHHARRRATRSTRSSSRTCACRSRTWSAPRTGAGRMPSPSSATSARSSPPSGAVEARAPARSSASRRRDRRTGGRCSTIRPSARSSRARDQHCGARDGRTTAPSPREARPRAGAGVVDPQDPRLRDPPAEPRSSRWRRGRTTRSPGSTSPARRPGRRAAGRRGATSTTARAYDLRRLQRDPEEHHRQADPRARLREARHELRFHRRADACSSTPSPRSRRSSRRSRAPRDRAGRRAAGRATSGSRWASSARSASRLSEPLGGLGGTFVDGAARRAARRARSCPSRFLVVARASPTGTADARRREQRRAFSGRSATPASAIAALALRRAAGPLRSPTVCTHARAKDAPRAAPLTRREALRARRPRGRHASSSRRARRAASATARASRSSSSTAHARRPRTPVQTMDGHHAAMLTLDDVEVAADRALGGEGAHARALEEAHGPRRARRRAPRASASCARCSR